MKNKKSKNGTLCLLLSLSFVLLHKFSNKKKTICFLPHQLIAKYWHFVCVCVCVGAGECFNLLLFSNLSADSNRTRSTIHRSVFVYLIISSQQIFRFHQFVFSYCLYTRISSLAGSLRFALFSFLLRLVKFHFGLLLEDFPRA